MGTLLHRWQHGFEVADQAYTKVWAYKKIWLANLVSVFLGFSYYKVNAIFYTDRYCLPCFVISFLIFAILYYFVSLTLFFYVYGLNKGLGLFECGKRALYRMRIAFFWILVLLPLPLLAISFLSVFTIPVLAFHGRDLRSALLECWLLIKRYILLVLGFTAYIGIIFIVSGFMLLLVRVFLFSLKLEWLGNHIILLGLSIVGSFLAAMWVFLQEYIYEEGV
jgi:hypothetical protein